MSRKERADNKLQGSGGDQGGRKSGSGEKEQGRKSSGNKKQGTEIALSCWGARAILSSRAPSQVFPRTGIPGFI